MDGRAPERRRPVIPRGVALPIALWAVVILTALSTSAFVMALLEVRLTRNHRDHAAALHVAEAGVAMATAVVTREASARSSADSISGSIDRDTFRASWEPRGDQVVITCRGSAGSAVRVVEAWLSFDASEASRISAWREVRS